jgi:hypothetical protein
VSRNVNFYLRLASFQLHFSKMMSTTAWDSQEHHFGQLIAKGLLLKIVKIIFIGNFMISCWFSPFVTGSGS